MKPDERAKAVERAKDAATLPDVCDRGKCVALNVAEMAQEILALDAQLTAANATLERIRKTLPFGDTCSHCRGGAGLVSCPNCGTSGVEPDLAVCVEDQLGHFSERAVAAEKESQRLREENETLRLLQGLPADLVAVLRDPNIVVARDFECRLADGRTLHEHLEEWRNAPSDTASASLPPSQDTSC